jgi:hypothetical protein
VGLVTLLVGLVTLLVGLVTILVGLVTILVQVVNVHCCTVVSLIICLFFGGGEHN